MCVQVVARMGLAAPRASGLALRPMVGGAGQPRTVLVVDDDPLFRAAVLRWRAGSLVVFAVADRDDAIERARAERPSIAIIDWCLGGGACGIDVIAPLREIQPALRIAIASAGLTTARTVAAMQAGANIAIDKPFTLSTVLRWLEDGLATRDLAPAAVEPLAVNERRYIERVLAESGHNLRRTANYLGVSRNRLKRLRGHSIPPLSDPTKIDQ